MLSLSYLFPFSSCLVKRQWEWRRFWRNCRISIGGATAGQRDPEKSSVPGTVVGQGGLKGDGLGVWYLCQIVELSGDVCVKCRHPKSLKSTTCFIFWRYFSGLGVGYEYIQYIIHLSWQPQMHKMWMIWWNIAQPKVLGSSFEQEDGLKVTEFHQQLSVKAVTDREAWWRGWMVRNMQP